jgi:hypothetical protein
LLHNTASTATAAPLRRLYRPSKQLQQVSDWLVKVFLGASLTQVGNMTVIATYLTGFRWSAEGPMAIITHSFLYLAGLI